MTFLIEGGKVLVDQHFEMMDLLVSREGIHIDADDVAARLRFDARDLLVLPGMVDVHGDAFERQIMPRPGVAFPLTLALAETDRQLAANGITTACLGVTMSWEPGLRGVAHAAAILDEVEALRPRALTDLLIHLRHETFNLEGEAILSSWIRDGRLAVLAFNDHMEGIVKTTRQKKTKLAQMVERSGLSEEEFSALVDRVWARRDEVAGSIVRLAAEARRAGLVMMSHDDPSPQERARFRALGCPIAEFPMNEETARAAIAAGEATVFGAPNIVRGGSHTGCPAAADMAGAGLLTILASDYYYPAMAQAPYLLDRAGIMPLAEGWSLVARNPAAALGLTDRGQIAEGMRADLILAKAHEDRLRIVATFCRGDLVSCLDASRIRSS